VLATINTDARRGQESQAGALMAVCRRTGSLLRRRRDERPYPSARSTSTLGVVVGAPATPKPVPLHHSAARQRTAGAHTIRHLSLGRPADLWHPTPCVPKDKIINSSITHSGAPVVVAIDDSPASRARLARAAGYARNAALHLQAPVSPTDAAARSGGHAATVTE
jgi:hypothetical protein